VAAMVYRRVRVNSTLPALSKSPARWSYWLPGPHPKDQHIAPDLAAVLTEAWASIVFAREIAADRDETGTISLCVAVKHPSPCGSRAAVNLEIAADGDRVTQQVHTYALIIGHNVAPDI